MHLIIAEKNIVAERIAAFLADSSKVQAKRDGKVVLYYVNDVVVMGLRGHVVELDFVEGYANWRDAGHPPRSLIDAPIKKEPTEKKLVAIMQKLARHADKVTIATDFDTEGELIGKEALELIRQVNTDVPIFRARFSAITKEEIVQAIAESESLDFNLAAAGESRQIIDLVWGASLTRFLTIAGRRGADAVLSVGRVQSPTLAMVVDREREIEKFVPEKYWMLSLTAAKDGTEVSARHTHSRFTDKAGAETAYRNTADPVVVTAVLTRHKTDKAPTPLDTTALIVGASRLGISAASAMNRAEELYMHGFISYPRTDNTTYPKSLDISEHLDLFAGGMFRSEVAYVRKNLRPIPTRGKKETTDHPPIYPTGLATHEDIPDTVTWKLYEFVVRRFFATLCVDAEWETLKVNMTAATEPYTTTGGRLLVSGWRTVYPYSKAEENILPAFVEGETLTLVSKGMEEKETQPPARYTQSRLIQRMEELGLGTKSTRTEVLSKLAARKYVEGSLLKPTVTGRTVTEALEKFAGTITEPTMTKTLEEHMGDIAAGTKTLDGVVTESRRMLAAIFDDLELNEEAIVTELQERKREEERIGPCPVCGKPLFLRRIAGGLQFIGCSGYPECSFHASVPPATWGNATKMPEICPVHGVNHVQLLRKGAPPWKIGCPLCTHINNNQKVFMMMPAMTEELVAKLHGIHLYTVYELRTVPTPELAEKLGISQVAAAKLLKEADDVLADLHRRSDMKKFISARVAPRRGRGHGKLTSALIALGIEDIEAISKASVATLEQARLNAQEAEKLITDAQGIINRERMRELGIPAVTLNKYTAAGFGSPEVFLAAHPAIIVRAAGVTAKTVCKHQMMAAAALGRPAPEKISKEAYNAGAEELAGAADDDTLMALAGSGVYNAASLHAAKTKELAKSSGIDQKIISAMKKSVKKPRVQAKK